MIGRGELVAMVTLSLLTLDNADRIAQDLTDAGLVDGRNKVVGKERRVGKSNCKC